MSKSTKRIVKGKIQAQKPEIVHLSLPSSFMECFKPFMWPDEIYAGRLTPFGHLVSLEQLPKVG